MTVKDAAEKMKWTRTVVMLLTLVSIAQCYGPHHPRGPHVHRRPVPPSNIQSNPTLDKELFQDEVHIKEDFDKIELDTSKMDLSELALYYFFAHDLDNNTKLDGLEILQALKHTMHEENDNMNLNDYSLTEGDLQYFVELVDKLLANEDLDGDGYLSYTEYFVAQQHSKGPTKT